MDGPIDVPLSEFLARRRRADGTDVFWASGSGGQVLTRWDLVGDAWVEASSVRADSWFSAVARDEDLISIRSEEVTEFSTPEPSQLLDLLTVAGGGEPEDVDWAFDVEEWETEDEDFRFEEGQTRRFVRVDGQRVQFIDADGSPVAVLSEADELVGGEQIAELVWNGGGDPGFNWLSAVRERVAVGWERGESTHRIRAFRHGDGPRSRAEMLRAWLVFADSFGTGGGAAAVALEPFDPNHTLSGDRREAWLEALAEQLEGSEYTFRVSFEAPEEVRRELRALLAVEDEGYVRVRDALADPVAGDWLRAELAEGLTQSLW